MPLKFLWRFLTLCYHFKCIVHFSMNFVLICIAGSLIGNKIILGLLIVCLYRSLAHKKITQQITTWAVMHLNQVPFQSLAVLNIIYCNLHSFWYLLLTFLDFMCFILGFSFGIYDDKRLKSCSSRSIYHTTKPRPKSQVHLILILHGQRTHNS